MRYERKMLLSIIVLCISTNIVKQMIENLHARVQVGWKILLVLRKKYMHLCKYACVKSSTVGISWVVPGNSIYKKFRWDLWKWGTSHIKMILIQWTCYENRLFRVRHKHLQIFTNLRGNSLGRAPLQDQVTIHMISEHYLKNCFYVHVHIVKRS